MGLSSWDHNLFCGLVCPVYNSFDHFHKTQAKLTLDQDAYYQTNFKHDASVQKSFVDHTIQICCIFQVL